MSLNTFPIVVEFKVGNLSQYIAGMKGAATATNQAGVAAKGAKREVAQMAGAFTAIVVARYVKQGVGAVIKGLSDLETGMSRLRLMTGLTGKELEAFRTRAQQIAAETSAAPAQILELMQQLRRATGSDADAMSGAESAAKLMQASFGKMNITQSGKMMADMMRSFRLTGDEAIAASDKIGELAKATGNDISDATRVMGKLSGAAVQAGQSFDTIMKSFYLAKISGETSETLATGILRMTKVLGSGRAQDAFHQMGISVKDSEGNIRDFMDIFTDISLRFDGNSVLMRQAMDKAFDQRSVKTAIYIMNAINKGIYDENGNLVRNIELKNHLNQVASRSGYLNKASQEYLATIVGLWGELRETAWNAIMKIAHPLLAVTSTILTAAKATADFVNEIIDGSPGLKAFAGVIGGVLLTGVTLLAGKAALGGIVTILKLVIGNITLSTGLFGIFTKVLFGVVGVAKGAAISLTGMNLALKGVTAVMRAFMAATGIGIVVVGLSLIIEHWDTIGNKIKQANEWMEKFSAKASSTQWLSTVISAIPVFGSTLVNVMKLQTAMMKKRDEQIAEEKRLAEIHKNAGKQMYDHWQLGSDEMNKVIDRIEGLSKYSPPVIQLKWYEKLRSKIDAAAKGAMGAGEIAVGKSLQGAYGRIDALHEISGERELNPRETSELQSLLADILVGTQKWAISGHVSQADVKGYQEHVVQQAAKIGTPMNREWTDRQQKLRGAQDMVNPEKTIDGYAGHLGRIVTDVWEVLKGTPDFLDKAIVQDKGTGTAQYSIPGIAPNIMQALLGVQQEQVKILASGNPRENTNFLRAISDGINKIAEAVSGKNTSEDPLTSSANYPFGG